MPRQSVVELPPSGTRTIFNEAAGMEGVVHFSIGQPDFPTPRHIIDAMVIVETKSFCWSRHTSSMHPSSA